MRTIVMTGGTSGFGRKAAEAMLATGEARLILAGRHQGPPRAETITTDLARLAEVRSFAAAVDARLGHHPIDSLVLNAGGGFRDTRTEDGLETNFAVNYLSHYLIIRLLEPRLAASSIVTLTTSGTHDPAEQTPLPAPRHANARLLAHPDLDDDADPPGSRSSAGRAYASAKLCLILLARACATDAAWRARDIRVVAYDPGPTPGTGLARDAGLLANLAWHALGTPLRHLNPAFNSRSAAADGLVDIALGRVVPPAGRVYAALRRGRVTWPDPSELARRDDLMRALVDESADLLGLPKRSRATVSGASS